MQEATATKQAKGKGIGTGALIDVAKMDALKEKGWRSQRDDSGWWAIDETGKYPRVGPAKSLKALHTAVMLKIEKAPAADEPKSAVDYDNLSQVGQDQMDEIASLGYRVDKVTSGFIASQTQGDGRVGPCESLVILYNEVKVVSAGSKAGKKERTEGNGSGIPAKTIDGMPTSEPNENTAAAPEKDDTTITLEVDPATGKPYLEGMAPAVNKQLSAAVIKQHEAKMVRVHATAGETAANNEMKIIGKLHKNLYMNDPKKPGTKVYKVGKIISRISPGEEKFTTVKEDDPDE